MATDFRKLALGATLVLMTLRCSFIAAVFMTGVTIKRSLHRSNVTMSGRSPAANPVNDVAAAASRPARLIRDLFSKELDLSAILAPVPRLGVYLPYHPAMSRRCYCMPIAAASTHRRIARAGKERLDFPAPGSWTHSWSESPGL
jgi:hypothetical protein